jgi:hypothetical protein
VNDLRRLFRDAVRNSQNADVQRGKLGILDSGGSPIVDVPGRPNHVYVRITRGTEETPAEALNITVPNKYGLAVWVGKTIDGNRAIIGIDQTTVAQQYDNAPSLNVPAHGATHWHLGTDPILVSPLQVNHFRTYPTSPLSLSVGVSDYLYFYDGEWLAHEDTTLDLTTKVPAATVTTQRIIVVGLDKGSNTLTTVDGEARFVTAADRNAVPFGIEDVRSLLAEAAPEDFEPSAAVRLYGGQTEIRQVDIFADAKITSPGGAASSLGDWDPDAPPVSPSAMDDEFDDDAVGVMWTEFDSGAIQTISEAGETLVLSRASNATAILTGIRQALPAGNFTFAIKVQVDLDTLDGFNELALAGLVLWEDATGDDSKAALWGMGCKGSGAAPLSGFALAHWTGHDDLIAVPSFVSSITAGQGIYLRARYNAGSDTFKFDYSVDGETWSGGGVADTPPDFTPSHIGIGLVNRSADAFAATFDFFRYRDRFDTVSDPVYGDFGSFRDEKAKVSAGDTTPGYLGSKIVAGTGIDLTVLNPGADETLEIAATGGSGDDEKAAVSANDTTPGYLNGKLVAGAGTTLTENNDGGDETLTISAPYYHTVQGNGADKPQRSKLDLSTAYPIVASVTDSPLSDKTVVTYIMDFSPTSGVIEKAAPKTTDALLIMDLEGGASTARRIFIGNLPFIQKATLDANSIIKADVDNTPSALTVAEQTLVGRKTGGVIDDLAAADVWELLGLPAVCQGRLSLSSTLPVPVADITAAGTLYFHPYMGNRITLYDGTRWVLHTIPDSGISLSLAGLTENRNYDVFIYDNAGTLTLEALAWSSHGFGTSTRATALTKLAGVDVKSGAATRRYLGSFRTTGTTGQCEDSEANRFLWNRNNQTWRRLHCRETTTNTWNGGGWRAWNGNTTPGEARMQLIVGLVEHYLPAGVTAELDSGVGAVALGVNVTDAQTTFSIRNGNSAIARGGLWEPILLPQVGYHWINVVQNSNATTNFRAVEANINVSC